MTTTLHPAARLRRSGDGNIALGKMAHVICDEHERIVRDLGQQNADMWLEALCGLLGGMVEPVRRDDPDVTGCPTCATATRALVEIRDAAITLGADAIDMMTPESGAAEVVALLRDLSSERDEARAEVDDVRAMLDAETRQHEETSRELDAAHAEAERLRAEVASLRPRPTRDELADYARRMRAAAAPDTDEADDGWEPGPWWSKDDGWDSPCWHVRRSRNESAARVLERKGGWSGYVWSEHQPMAPKETTQPTRRAAIEWCEALPEMADVIATWTSAPTVETGKPSAAPDADETDAVLTILGPWWSVANIGLSLRGDRTSYAHVAIPRWMEGRSDPEPWRASVSPRPGEHQGESAWFASMADGVRWCERHPHLSSFFASWHGAQQSEAAYTSAPTVGATDAGPDAPALIVEGDDGTGAREARAVPAAPVSGAEQSCGETGVDRPRDDERIVGPREGDVVLSRANTPYGYEIDDSGDDLVLLTVQSEAAVMLRICELLDRRANAPAIAAALNADGHRSRKGTQWTPSSVRARILGSVDEWREVGR